MFWGSIKDVTTLVKFLNTKADEKNDYLAKFDKEREADQLDHFFNSYGPDLHIALVHSREAERMLYLAVDCRANHVKMSENAYYDILKAHVTREITNLNTRITSRSTSMSSNLAEDAKSAFYIELFKKMSDF